MDVITMQAVNKVLRKMNAEYGGMYEAKIATEDQDTFSTTDDFSMNDDHTLHVYVDGALAVEGTDYTKLDSKTVKFTNPLHAGEVVLFTTELAGSPKYSNPPYDDTLVKSDISNLNTAVLAVQNAIQAIKTAIDDDVDGEIIDTITNIKAQWAAADSSLQALIDDKVDSSVTDAIVSEITNARGGKSTLLERLNEISALASVGYDDTVLSQSVNDLAQDMTDLNNEIVAARNGKASLKENLDYIAGLIPTAYDDTALRDRVTTLEGKKLNNFITVDTVTGYEYVLVVTNGSILNVLTDNGKVSKAYTDLTLGDLSAVVTNLTLPVLFEEASISWTSSDTSTINIDGIVNQPLYAAGDKDVTLTATLTVNAESKIKTFTAHVLALPQTDTEKVSVAKANLTIGDTTAVTSNLILPSEQDGCTVTWSSTDTTILANDGTVTRPTLGSGNATITLTATITSNAVSEVKDFTVTVLEATV